MANQGIASASLALPEVPQETLLERIAAESAQAFAIAVKDIRIYYATPPMIMFGLLMPFFMFFSFSVGRGMGTEGAIAKMLALTTFFTASSAGPVILPMERRTRTFDRLLVAPLSLVTVLLGKTMVGAFFGLVISLVPLIAGLAFLGVSVSDPLLLAVGLIGGAVTFSSLGILFASFPADNPGAIMMPSTLLRWPLLFISGIFIPLGEMSPVARVVSYISPLTYTQDLFSHAVAGAGVQSLTLDLVALPVSLVLFLVPAMKLHGVSRKLGN